MRFDGEERHPVDHNLYSINCRTPGATDNRKDPGAGPTLTDRTRLHDQTVVHRIQDISGLRFSAAAVSASRE
jgi:hypothetical protein